jgi:predicted transcriptional regulator
MTNKTHQLGVRLDADVWRRLEDLQRLTSLDKVALVRAAIMAMLEAAEREGGIKFPLRIVSEVGRNS